MTELHDIFKEIKEKYHDDEKIKELEHLLKLGDFIDDGQPTFPMILEAVRALETLEIPKSKVQRIKILVNDIERNKKRIVSIFSRLQNARDKEDQQDILKRLLSEELLTWEQYSQLSKLEEIDPQSIATTIKETKVG